MNIPETEISVQEFMINQEVNFVNERERQAARFVLSRIEAMDSGFMKMKPIWDGDYQYYKSVPDSGRNPHDSNLFVPRTREIVEAIQPRMAGDFLNLSGPFIDVVGRNPDDQKRAEVVKLWLFYRMQEMNLPLSLLPYIKQGLIYGTTVGMMIPDPSGSWRSFSGRAEKPKDVFVPIDIYDYRIDPEATCHADAFDEAIKTRSRLSDLISMAEAGVHYRNLEEVKTDLNYDNKEDGRNRITDNERNVLLKDVKLIEWWGPYQSDDGRGEVLTRIVLANEVCILIEEDPFRNGKSPFVFGRFEFDPFEIYGTGIPRMLRPLQKELNEIRNLRINLLHRFISPMLLVREGSLVNPEDIRKWRPYGLIRVRSGEPINNVVVPLLPGGSSVLSNGLIEESQINTDIQRRSAVPEYIHGINSDAGRQTATEFSQRLLQASLIFTYNFKLLAEESLKKIAGLILEHDQANMNKKRVIRILGSENTAEYLSIGPEDIKGEYDFFPVVDPSHSEENIMRDILTRSIAPLSQLDQYLREEGKRINWGEIAEKFIRRMKLEGSSPIIEESITEVQPIIENNNESKRGISDFMDEARRYGNLLGGAEGMI